MTSPIILALLTILIWSTVGIFAKAVNFPGNSGLYFITVLSALVTFQLNAWYKNRKLFLPKISELFSIKSLFASLGFGFYWLFIGQSIVRSTNASVPMALQCSWPLFNSLFASLFFASPNREIQYKFITKSTVGLLTGFTGIIILFWGDYSAAIQSNILSTLFALCSGASFGLYSAYSTTIEEKDHLNFLILSCICGLVVLCPWVVIDIDSVINLSLSNILLAIVFGVIADGLGTYLWTKANRIVTERGHKLSSITSLTLILPFLTAFFLYLIFGEEQIFQTSYLVGLFMLLIGISICKSEHKA